jgi:hypothetical protein
MITDYTSLPPKTTPSLQKAQRVSLKERIPSTYKGVDHKAIAGPSNFTRPSGTITARELLEQLLYKTLQKIKELKI